MSDVPLRIANDYLRRLATATEALTDADLLARYARDRDQEAFAQLVGRHGPMILGVCRRALGHSADADDAFQATFLALSRSTGQIQMNLPGWLHRVAVRATTRSLRRAKMEAVNPDPLDPHDPFAAVEWRDLRRLLDAELDRLPVRWRAPLVLCYLDGLTRDEAAARLGWSLRTLHRRLNEGRARLRARLTRHGLAPAVLGAAVLAIDELKAIVPPALAGRTLSLVAGGTAIPSAIRLLLPNNPLVGGLAMKVTVCGLMMLGGVAVLLGVRQPAGADPLPKQPAPDELLVRAPLKKDRPPEDPRTKKVMASQEKAIAWLKKQQVRRDDGQWGWETDKQNTFQAGGITSLVLLALIESGLKADDEVVARGLKYIRGIEPTQVYMVGLQTQVFCKANQREDADRIKRNVKWLKSAVARRDSGQLAGWSYGDKPGGRGDVSNTRYAVAALSTAHHAGFKVQTEGFWEGVRDMFILTQRPDGGWGYIAGASTSTHTMTVSGVLCLTLALDIIGKEDKVAEETRSNGYAWIANEFRLVIPPYTFYNHDVVAALGRASDRKEFGTKDKKHEWYGPGTEWLLKNQKDGGEWKLSDAIDGNPLIATSFALRFLASRPD